MALTAAAEVAGAAEEAGAGAALVDGLGAAAEVAGAGAADVAGAGAADVAGAAGLAVVLGEEQAEESKIPINDKIRRMATRIPRVFFTLYPLNIFLYFNKLNI